MKKDEYALSTLVKRLKDELEGKEPKPAGTTGKKKAGKEEPSDSIYSWMTELAKTKETLIEERDRESKIKAMAMKLKKGSVEEGYGGLKRFFDKFRF